MVVVLIATIGNPSNCGIGYIISEQVSMKEKKPLLNPTPRPLFWLFSRMKHACFNVIASKQSNLCL
jgi:hypothetical protein